MKNANKAFFIKLSPGSRLRLIWTIEVTSLPVKNVKNYSFDILYQLWANLGFLISAIRLFIAYRLYHEDKANHLFF